MRGETLEAMRRLPGRQAQAEICRNAQAYPRHQIAFQKKQFPEPADAMLDDLDKGLPGIGWLAVHCDCGPTLDALDAFAMARQDTPAIRKFRETLAALPRLH